VGRGVARDADRRKARGVSDADELIARLQLQPHPEGGHYRETWRDVPADGGRGAGTAIYFLLRAGEESRWHRVDAVEIWHHYDGAPLDLWIDDARPVSLSPWSPQVIVPAGAWQRARSTGAYTLVGCTVSPAFEFRGFELAAPGWHPPRRDGMHELSGPYELLQYRGGLPVAYHSLDRHVPDAAEERDILARIEAQTGLRVVLDEWVIEQGDPRDSGRIARVTIAAS
jgi:predicted cupin superfamily sugar epimerase